MSHFIVTEISRNILPFTILFRFGKHTHIVHGQIHWWSAGRISLSQQFHHDKDPVLRWQQFVDVIYTTLSPKKTIYNKEVLSQEFLYGASCLKKTFVWITNFVDPLLNSISCVMISCHFFLWDANLNSHLTIFFCLQNLTMLAGSGFIIFKGAWTA
jgi:hypothetical protein